jgi:uncharacterized protein YjbI with pentapeptide repeats
VPDAGEDRFCEVGPMCRALRRLPADHFDVPTSASSSVVFDCDDDSVEDAFDNCLGVPNPTQAARACAGARAACDRLRAGETALSNADLRGCVLDAPIEMAADLQLSGARIECSHIVLRASGGSPRRIDLSRAQIRSASLTLIGDATPLEASLSDATVRETELSTEGTASLRGLGATFEDVGVYVHPAAEVVAIERTPFGAIDLSDASLSRVTLYEGASSRAARVRIESSTLTGCALNVQALSLVAVEASESRIAASELSALQLALRMSEVRAEVATIASSTLTDVVFDTCGEMRVTDSELGAVDLPACELGYASAFRTVFVGARVAGGLEVRESEIRGSVIGDGPTTTLVSRASVLDGTTFCELDAAAFYGGEIRCTRCADDAFMSGRSVCVDGTALYERGCPAIELAPGCE